MSKNALARAAQKKSLLAEITKELETKGDWKNSAIETVKDAVCSLGGGFLGAAIGRPSLLAGAALTAMGHYHKNRYVTSLGVGMMAAGGAKTAGSVSGTPKAGLEGFIDGAKERIKAYKDGLTEKLFLDKVLKKEEKKDESTKGVGEVEYFTYPESKELAAGAKKEEIDLTALSEFEKQVERSGQAFRGALPAEDMGEIDPTERNF